MNRHNTPPRLAAWLLERLRPHGDSDIVLGDFEEEYHYLRARYGARYAHWWYRQQVLLSLPGFTTQLVTWSLIMLHNYLKIAVRNLLRHGRYTVINVVGLAVALACCIVAYLNYDFSYGFDTSHENAERIYRVNSTKIVNDRVQEWGITPMPLGPALKAEFPFVEEHARFSRTQGVFQYGDKVLNETVSFADPALFEMFTFPLKQGPPDVLQDPNKIVISQELAVKYFGQENPMDRQVTIRFDDALRTFTIGAVVEEIPQNSSIQFDILTNYDNLRVFGDLDDWKRWGLVTFIEVSDPARLADLNDRLRPYLDLQNAARPDWEIERFYFVPLPEMFLTSETTRAYILVEGMHPAAIVAPSILAVLLLLMACFNFMNTAIALAGKRLKEIGVRKVVGGLRRQLIGQFMSESMLLCVLAFGLALLLAEVFAPAYSSLWPYLDLPIDYADNAPLLVFLAALLLITGVLAGAYPAIYISSFNPVTILKGRQQLAGLNTFTGTLLTAQLTIAVLVILGSIVFTNNASYQETVDIGYDRDMVLVVTLGEPERFAPYRDALVQNPNILSVAGSRSHIAYSNFGRVVETQPTERREAVKSEVDLYLVGEDYVETMGLTIIDGRGFDPDMDTDFTDAVLVNETLARELGWAEPVGQIMKIDSVRYEVIGVLEDFYDSGLWDPVDPCVFRLTTLDNYYYLTARVRGDELAATNAFLAETWARIAPDDPYEGRYQDDVMAEAMLINRSIKTVFYYLALLAIVIAAAGLFAMVSLNIARRTKEIGIRKVLGASVSSIALLLSTAFTKLVVAAFVLATPIAYLAMTRWLENFAYRVEMSWPIFLLAGALALAIALLTVSYQAIKAALTNPVKALRYE
ncbi:MAG: ABC transporter permease [Bacteroidetes bacterium]|nr:ABC transporter permease [Bacteroidota bacterium]